MKFFLNVEFLIEVEIAFFMRIFSLNDEIIYNYSSDKLPDLPPSRASQIMKFGYPGFDNLRTFEDFVLSYDRKTRTAHWVSFASSKPMKTS